MIFYLPNKSVDFTMATGRHFRNKSCYVPIQTHKIQNHNQFSVQKWSGSWP